VDNKLLATGVGLSSINLRCCPLLNEYVHIISKAGQLTASVELLDKFAVKIAQMPYKNSVKSDTQSTIKLGYSLYVRKVEHSARW